MDHGEIVKRRAWWAHRQGLLGRLPNTAAPADVLASTGWARSVGGSTPYLTVFSRTGLSRERTDAAVAAAEICELPSARGCTYVLPAADYAVGLTVGAHAPEAELATVIGKTDVTRAEIERLCTAVTQTLDPEVPLSPRELRARVGEAARSLGAAGKKIGTSSTLPLALGLLQSRGRIRRIPLNGRLDQQRFGYVVWTPSPFDGPDGVEQNDRAPPDINTARTELARRYFSWAGPASLQHFRRFSGLSAAAANQAIADLDLTVIDAEQGRHSALLPRELAAEYAAFEPPPQPTYALVSWIDGIHLLHRDLGRLLDPVDASRPLPGAGSDRTLRDAADPPCQLITDRGRVVGLWEFDPDAGEIVYQSFVPVDDALAETLDCTAEFVRDQLGDVRGNSLDSVASRQPRLDDLRAR